jgi:hypothetical protein
MNHTKFFAVLLISTTFAINFALAQDSSARAKKDPAKTSTASDDPGLGSQDFTELLRKDVRSQKKQIVAMNMELSDAEAERFWPVYDRYATDLAKLYDTKLTLLNNYGNSYDTMTDDEAETYIRKRADVEESIMQLRLKYMPAFRKVLSGRETALFYQIDWRLGLAIDVQLAQAPMLNQ